MEEDANVQAVLSSALTPATTPPFQATSMSTKPAASAAPHSHSDSEHSSQFSVQSDNRVDVDDEGTLDGQYQDVLVKLQLLTSHTIQWKEGTSSTRGDIHSFLETALIELRVWINEIADSADFALKGIGSLKNRNPILHKALQQRVIKIRHILNLITKESNGEVLSIESVSFHGLELGNCNLLNDQES